MQIYILKLQVFVSVINDIRSNSSHTVVFFAGTFLVTFPQPIRFCPCLFLHCLHNTSLSQLTSTIKKILRNFFFWMTPSCCLCCSNATTPEDAVNILHNIFCTILTTNLAACVCVRKILPISALTLLFRLQTSRKFGSHSKIPIRCL